MRFIMPQATLVYDHTKAESVNQTTQSYVSYLKALFITNNVIQNTPQDGANSLYIPPSNDQTTGLNYSIRYIPNNNERFQTILPKQPTDATHTYCIGTNTPLQPNILCTIQLKDDSFSIQTIYVLTPTPLKKGFFTTLFTPKAEEPADPAPIFEALMQYHSQKQYHAKELRTKLMLCFDKHEKDLSEIQANIHEDTTCDTNEKKEATFQDEEATLAIHTLDTIGKMLNDEEPSSSFHVK